MSKFTKFLVPFLLIALLFAQMLPAHAASAETLPEINPNLCGLYEGEGFTDRVIYNLTTHEKTIRRCLYMPDMMLNNVICMLGADGAVTCIYIDDNDYAYCVDERIDPQNLELISHFSQKYYDFAAAPLAGQVWGGRAIAIPENMCGLSLISIWSGGSAVDSKYVDFSEDIDLSDIAVKYIDEYSGEYYILDRSGTIWCVSLELTEDIHAIQTAEDEITIKNVEKVLETGVNATSQGGFYYDGTLIYRTYSTLNGSCLMAIDPNTKDIYNYGVLENGVTIWGLFEQNKVAPNCNDVPEPIDTLDTAISGLFRQNGQGDNRLVTFYTKNMKNSKQHLEFRGNPDLVLQNVICQENASGEIETYYFGNDKYIYVVDEQDHYFLNQTVMMADSYADVAPGPYNYQRYNGWAVAVERHNTGLVLINLYTGEEEKTVRLNQCMDPALIAAKKLTGSKVEYYVLDRAGEIWSITISFPDFTVVEEKEIQDTCIYPDGNYDGFYFDGTWLFRTYRDISTSSVLAYHPETDILYNLGPIEQGMLVYGLYEAGRIPTVELDEHDWEFDQFVWDTELGCKAHAVYTCSICGEETEVEATVTLLSHGIVSEFEAAIRADEAPDGEERTDTMEIMPTFGGFVWDTTNGVKAYAIYVCNVFGCYDHQYRVQATVTKVNSYTVIPKYKAVVTAEQAPDGVERTETKTSLRPAFALNREADAHRQRLNELFMDFILYVPRGVTPAK